MLRVISFLFLVLCLSCSQRIKTVSQPVEAPLWRDIDGKGSAQWGK